MNTSPTPQVEYAGKVYEARPELSPYSCDGCVFNIGRHPGTFTCEETAEFFDLARLEFGGACASRRVIYVVAA